MEKVNPHVRSSGLTMTVAELITELQKYDPDMPVLATWESVGAGFRVENFEVVTHGGREELIIDVEDYG